MPMFVAPIAGALSDRIGGTAAHGAGLALQAVGLAGSRPSRPPTRRYASLVAPFILSGIGMALFFAPVANVVLSAVRPEEEGKASGANNAIRELGGVLGVAVLASIFARSAGTSRPRRSSTGSSRRSGSARPSSLRARSVSPDPAEASCGRDPCRRSRPRTPHAARGGLGASKRERGLAWRSWYRRRVRCAAARADDA